MAQRKPIEVRSPILRKDIYSNLGKFGVWDRDYYMCGRYVKKLFDIPKDANRFFIVLSDTYHKKAIHLTYSLDFKYGAKVGLNHKSPKIDVYPSFKYMVRDLQRQSPVNTMKKGIYLSLEYEY